MAPILAPVKRQKQYSSELQEGSNEFITSSILYLEVTVSDLFPCPSMKLVIRSRNLCPGITVRIDAGCEDHDLRSSIPYKVFLGLRR